MCCTGNLVGMSCQRFAWVACFGILTASLYSGAERLLHHKAHHQFTHSQSCVEVCCAASCKAAQV